APPHTPALSLHDALPIFGSESNRVFLPLSSALARFKFQENEDQVDRILLRLSAPEQLAAGARVLAAVLDQRHAGMDDYTLVVPRSEEHTSELQSRENIVC